MTLVEVEHSTAGSTQDKPALAPQARRLRGDGTVWALLGSVLLAAVYGRTVLLNLQSGVLGGDVDGYENLWNYWWVKTALFDLHQNPYFTDYLYYPSGVSLRFHTLNPLNALITLPVNLTLGYIPGINLLFVLALCLTCFFAFLLVRDITGDAWAAFGGAAIFTFTNHNLLGHWMAGQAEKISAQWLPLYFFLLFRTLHGRPIWHSEATENKGDSPAGGSERPLPGRVDTGRWRVYAVLTLLTLLALTLTDWQHVLFAVLATLLYFGFVVVTERSNKEKLRIFGKLAAVGGAYALLVGPTLLLPMVREALAEPWLSVGYQSARRALDLLDFVRPGLANSGYLAYVLAGIGLWAILRGRGWGRSTAIYWGVIALIFNILALGPDLIVNETETGIPLPYALFQYAPVFSIGRDPGRYNLTATLGLSVLVAVGLSVVMRRGGLLWSKRSALGETNRLARALGAAIACLVLVVSLTGFVVASGNVPVDPPRWPDLYKQIANDSEPYALLELPAFTEKGLGENHYMMYQVLHHKQRFGGRWARDHKLTNPNNFMKKAGLYHHLFLMDARPEALSYYYPPQDFLDRTDYGTQGLALLNKYHVRYIILYKDALEPGWNEAEFQQVMSQTFGSPVKPSIDDDLMRVYPVPQAAAPPPNPLTLDVGNGWSTSEIRGDGKVFRLADASAGSEAELYTVNVGDQPVRAVLRFTAYAVKQPRTLNVAINGYQVSSLPLKPEDPAQQAIEVTVPPGLNTLTFVSPEPPIAGEDPQQDARLLMFGMYDVSLKPK